MFQLLKKSKRLGRNLNIYSLLVQWVLMITAAKRLLSPLLE